MDRPARISPHAPLRRRGRALARPRSQGSHDRRVGPRHVRRVPRQARQSSEEHPRRFGMSDEISIQFSRFSAFYTPLIAMMAGGFLKDEGFAPKHSVAPAGKSAIEGLVNG